MTIWVILDRDEQSSRSSHVRYASKSDHSRHQSKLSRSAMGLNRSRGRALAATIEQIIEGIAGASVLP